MKAISRILAVAIIMVLILLAAGACSKKADITLTANNDGAVIEVNRGDIIEIALKGDPSTGNIWVTESFDDTIFSQVTGVDFKLNPDLTGEGDFQVFHFMALKSGLGTLQLAYRRALIMDTLPEKVFTVDVLVR